MSIVGRATAAVIALTIALIAAPPTGVALDRATAMIGAREGWRREPSMGRGVVVGVVDSGIDPTHADFLAPDGRSRVAYVLEIGAEERGAHPDLESMGHGAVWSSADLDEARASGGTLPRDVDGHGTAVAAAAAGDGGDDGTPGALAGVAPNAILVAVRAMRPGMSRLRAEDVLVGARFVIEVATRMAAPAVVVIPSASPRDEPTADGTPLSVALDVLARSAPGRVIVAAAGNLGDLDDHRSLELRPGEAAVELSVPAADDGPSGVELFLRLSPTGDGRFVAPTLSLVPPGGARASLGALEVGPPSAVDPERDCANYEPIDCFPDGRVPDVERDLEQEGRVRLFRPTETDPDGGRWWTLSLIGGGELPSLANGRYTLLFADGGGRLDVVLIRADRTGAWRAPFLVDGADSRANPALVGFPGAAAGIVSVGAVTSREESAIATFVPTDQSIWPPTRTTFSSAGPTFDARPEPDLVAPGRYVESALAAGSRYAMSDLYATYRQDDRIALAGTSMAAPLVAGALALVLARHPMLSSDALGALARASARGAGTPGAAYDVELGAGLLSVPALLDAADALVAGTTIAADPASSTASLTATRLGPSESTTRIVVRPRAVDGSPTHALVAATTTRGRLGAPETDAAGAVLWTLRLDDVRDPSRVRVDVTLDGTPMAPLFVKVERDRALVRGGGCAVGPMAEAPSSGSSGAAIALLLLAAARRGRHRVARGATRSRHVPAWPNATRSPPPSA